MLADLSNPVSTRRTSRPGRRTLGAVVGVGITAAALLGLAASAGTASAAPPAGQRALASVDSYSAYGGHITLNGWALDTQRSSASATVAVLDSTNAPHYATAGISRPDVDAAYGITGNHGYSLTFDEPSTVDATRSYCIYVLFPGGTSGQATCVPITVSHSPRTSLDSVSAATGQPVAISGWAADPDVPSTSIAVRTYVDGTFAVAGVANQQRTDVDTFLGTTGDHGFTVRLTPLNGTHDYCTYAINSGPGSNVLIGCRSLTVNNDPVGYQDGPTGSDTTAVLSGWAFDPNSPATSIYVDIYVDGGTFVGHLPTTINRPDVNAVYGLTGVHGWSGTVPVLASPHTYCAYGINIGAGSNSLLGCYTV